MNKILEKHRLSDDVFMLKVEAPLIAREHRAGQFIILQLNDDFGERIPLTIADTDGERGSITLIFQAVGKTTIKLAALKAGEHIENLVGPLGRPTHIEKFGTAVCVGGGIGIAPLHPIVKALKNSGNRLVIIMGARSKNLLILEKEMASIADELITCTDDGSYGRHCLVSQPLKELCAGTPKPDIVFAIGPPIMMKVCSDTTLPFSVRTVVSLNTIMVDGTGMCGACRVTVGGKTRFVCVDGPEFDGHQVDFDNMMKRLRAYAEQEKHSRENCRVEMQITRQKEQAR